MAAYNSQERHTLPTQKKRPGRPKKTGKRAVNIVKRELEKNPRVSARKVKQNNPEIFGECLVNYELITAASQTLGTQATAH